MASLLLFVYIYFPILLSGINPKHIVTLLPEMRCKKNASTNGGDASRVGIEKGGKYKLY